MYLSTTNINYNPVYRETVRQPIKTADFFKGKPRELENYRNTWTKRSHIFETTYAFNTDKVAKEILSSYKK